MQKQEFSPVPVITFEPVQESDIDVLWHIYLYYIRYSTATFQISDISVSDMRRVLLSHEPAYHAYTIRYGGQICGYTYYAKYRPREAFSKAAEVTIYLKNGYSGHGIGSKALARIEADARESGIHTLLALICHENAGSIRLFRKTGYDEHGKLKEVGFKFGRYLDLLVYQKQIQQHPEAADPAGPHAVG